MLIGKFIKARRGIGAQRVGGRLNFNPGSVRVLKPQERDGILRDPFVDSVSYQRRAVLKAIQNLSNWNFEPE